MQSYRKERIDNSILFFALNHYKKTKKYLSQTSLYKYLAFFEFRYLKKNGDMPLGLTYMAMPYGPVPIEIYENRDNPNYFSLIQFEQVHSKAGKSYLVKAKGKFAQDYFANAELEEMNNLIEIFAQRWVGASEMSDASHQDIKAWKKTFSNRPNTIIDPIQEFERDIENAPEETLSTEELKYLMHRKMQGIIA